MSTFGETAWDSTDGDFEKKTVNTKDLFLRLIKGSNEVRLVTNPYVYLVHKYKKEGDQGYGQKVSCSASHGSCQLCDTGDKAKRRWLIGVICRKTNTYKVLDISYQVYSQIKKLNAAPRWGDPKKYDIDIVVDPNGGAAAYYSVQPIPKEPLSASDQSLADKADLEDLQRRTTPFTPAQVQTRLDRLNGATPQAPVGKPATKGKATPKAAPAPVVDMSDDGDTEFADYNSN